MLFRRLAADARVERAGATPGRAVVVRRRRRLDTCNHSSTVLGPRPEGEELFGNQDGVLFI
jgi:hypothetical protein